MGKLVLVFYGFLAAFLNCGCITCISVQQNFEVLTPRFFSIHERTECLFLLAFMTKTIRVTLLSKWIIVVRI
jgi:hypothetical protein